MNLGKVVAQNVKAKRIELGLSQIQLAKKTGLTVRYISRLENTSPNITLDVLERLAAGLGCDAGSIVSTGKAQPSSKKLTDTLDSAIRSLQSIRSRL